MLHLAVPTYSADECLQRVAKFADKGAFESLFRDHGPRLKAYAQSLGASAAVADEVVQETFLNVWQRAKQFDPARGSAAAWLFSIARNTFISHVRRQRRFEVRVDDPAFVSSDHTPEQLASSAQSQQQLQAALQTLPPEQKQVIEAAYGRGLPLSEVAQQNGLPLGTVKTRARLALEKLRAVFAPKDLS